MLLELWAHSHMFVTGGAGNFTLLRRFYLLLIRFLTICIILLSVAIFFFLVLVNILLCLSSVLLIAARMLWFTTLTNARNFRVKVSGRISRCCITFISHRLGNAFLLRGLAIWSFHWFTIWFILLSLLVKQPLSLAMRIVDITMILIIVLKSNFSLACSWILSSNVFNISEMTVHYWFLGLILLFSTTYACRNMVCSSVTLLIKALASHVIQVPWDS